MNQLQHLIALVIAVSASLASADEVRVFAAGAAKHAVDALAPLFQQATGHTLRTNYDTVGALRDRVLQAPAGEAADIVILSDTALATLKAAGRLNATPAQSIGRVVVALAVKQGAAIPALSNANDLRQALLAATSIAYGDPARGATAGTHFANHQHIGDARHIKRKNHRTAVRRGCGGGRGRRPLCPGCQPVERDHATPGCQLCRPAACALRPVYRLRGCAGKWVHGGKTAAGVLIRSAGSD